jgi:hypothetical protein
MAVLKLTRWILLYLLAQIEFAASQNITVLVHFGSGDALASVIAAHEIAATYVASYTNECRSGPCSPLTIYTDIMVQGPSTAVRTNVGDPSANQTFQCNVISLTTGTCTYISSTVRVHPICRSYFCRGATTTPLPRYAFLRFLRVTLSDCIWHCTTMIRIKLLHNGT